MKVRLNFSHQIQLNYLQRLDHDFYVPHDQAQWNSTAEKDYEEMFPDGPEDNLHLDEDIDDPDVVVKGDDADIQMAINPKASQRKDCINAYLTETQLIRDPPPNDYYYYLGKGVDTSRFGRWVPDVYFGCSKRAKLGRDIVAVGNNIANRGHVFDLEVVDQLREEFDDRFKVYGRGDGCDEFVTHDQLSNVLKSASVYVHIAKNSVAPNSLLEAMSTGIPIVSVWAYNITDFITDGYDGIITDDVVEGVHHLLSNHIEAEEWGINARVTAEGKYNLKRYLQRWDNLLNIAKEFKRRRK